METIIGILTVIAIVAVVLGANMLIACGLVKLICMCFGLAFTWKMAIEVWLVLVLVSGFFRSSKGKE